jgi:hypothetical protein
MKRLTLIAIFMVSLGALSQKAAAGPFDTLRNFFVRPHPETHHIRPHPHNQEKASPSPMLSPGAVQPQDPQPNGSPSPGPLITAGGRVGQAPTLAAPPLY